MSTPLTALRTALDDISTLATFRDGQVLIHDASAYNTLVGRIVMLTNGDYVVCDAATPPALDRERLRDALTEWAVEFLGGLSFNVPVLRRQGWAAKRAPDVADSILADPAILAVLSTGDET